VALTADEEAGDDANGVSWLLATHRDLIDAQIVINPDGGQSDLPAGHGANAPFAVSLSGSFDRDDQAVL
jgi:hypothetical protein